jgi:hypothetical protein
MNELYETRDGLILCETHFKEAFQEMVPPYRTRERDQEGDGHKLDWNETTRAILKPTCAMCSEVYAPGRVCLHCSTPLHPLWPACYCSNECAFADVEDDPYSRKCTFCGAPPWYPCRTVHYKEHALYRNGQVHEQPHAARLKYDGVDKSK